MFNKATFTTPSGKKFTLSTKQGTSLYIREEKSLSAKEVSYRAPMWNLVKGSDNAWYQVYFSTDYKICRRTYVEQTKVWGHEYYTLSGTEKWTPYVGRSPQNGDMPDTATIKYQDEPIIHDGTAWLKKIEELAKKKPAPVVPPICPLELIAKERALVRVICSTIDSDVSEKYWDHEFRCLNEPSTYRWFKADVTGDRTFFVDPRGDGRSYTQREVGIRGRPKDTIYGKRINTSLLPSNGKNKLYGAIHRVAMGFDYDLVDDIEQKFVFDVNSSTNSRFHIKDSTSAALRRKATTIDAIRQINQKNVTDGVIRKDNDWSDISVCVPKHALKFFMAVMDKPEERLNALRIKLKAKAVLGVDVPVVVNELLKLDQKPRIYSDTEITIDVLSGMFAADGSVAKKTVVALYKLEEKYINSAIFESFGKLEAAQQTAFLTDLEQKDPYNIYTGIICGSLIKDVNDPEEKTGKTRLHRAVEAGKADFVENLCKKSQANAGIKSTQGQTPFALAMQLKKNDIVEILLYHATATLLAEDVSAAFWEFVKTDQLKLAELILSKKPEAIRPKEADLALEYCSHKGAIDHKEEHYKFARLLLDRCKEVPVQECKIYSKYTALHYAVVNNNNEMVKILCERGADPFQKSDNTNKSKLELTPLEMALYNARTFYKNNLKTPLIILKACRIDILFEYWKKLDEKILCTYPLEISSLIVDRLVSHYTQPKSEEHLNTRAADGKTLFHLAASLNLTEPIAKLLEAKMDITVQNNKGTPIRSAAINKAWKVVMQIASSQQEDKEGNAQFGSALVYACQAGETDVASKLLEQKAHIIWREDGKYPIHFAVIQNNQSLVDKILENSMRVVDDVNIQDEKTGETPLHYAITGAITRKEKQFDLILKLCKAQAHAGIKCKQGITPLGLALKHNSFQLFELLLNNTPRDALDVGDLSTAFMQLILKNPKFNNKLYLAAFKILKSRPDAIKNISAAEIGVVLEQLLFIAFKKPKLTFPLYELAIKLLELRPDAPLTSHLKFNNYTPFHYVLFKSAKNQQQLIKILCERGADLAVKSDNKNKAKIAYTPLEVALFKAEQSKQFENVLLLFEHATRDSLKALWQGHTFITFSLLPEDIQVKILAMLCKKIDSDTPDANGNTLLHFAAKLNCVDIVESLIKSKANTAAENKEDKATPIVIAAKTKNWNVVHKFIDLGPDTQDTAKFGWALLLALENKQLELALKLLNKGKAVSNWCMAQGMYPLVYAVQYVKEFKGQPEYGLCIELISVMLTHKPKINIATAALDAAIANKNYEVMILLANSQPISVADVISKLNNEGRGKFILECHRKGVKILSLLQHIGLEGSVALLAESYHKDLAAADLLSMLNSLKGCDFYQGILSALFPLVYAKVSISDVPLWKTFLEHFVKLLEKDQTATVTYVGELYKAKLDITLLLKAVSTSPRYKALCKTLLQHLHLTLIQEGQTQMLLALLTPNKELIDAPQDSKNGDTLLHLAARLNQPEIVVALLEAKANPFAVNIKKKTVIFVAAANKHWPVVNILAQRHTKEDKDDKAQLLDVLYLAFENKQLVVAEQLIDAHAPVDWRDNNGYTPLHMAIVHSQLSLVTKILKKCSVNKRYCEVPQSERYPTPLFTAIESEAKEEIITLLLAQPDIDINTVCQGRSALQAALAKKNDKIVQALVQKQCNLHPSILTDALRDKNYDLIKLLLTTRFNSFSTEQLKTIFVSLNAESSDRFELLEIILQSADRDTVIAIWHASQFVDLFSFSFKAQQKESFVLFHQKLQSPNVQTADGYTLLHWAIKRNMVSHIGVQIQAGADLSLRSKEALEFAVDNRNCRVVCLLANKSAKVLSSVLEKFDFPLKLELVKEIFAHESPLLKVLEDFTQSPDFETLIIAFLRDKFNTLLTPAEIKSTSGGVPVPPGIKDISRLFECIPQFLQWCPSLINLALDKEANTLLHLAAKYAPAVIVPLVKGGANPGKINKNGETPLLIATKNPHLQQEALTLMVSNMQEVDFRCKVTHVEQPVSVFESKNQTVDRFMSDLSLQADILNRMENAKTAALLLTELYRIKGQEVIALIKKTQSLEVLALFLRNSFSLILQNKHLNVMLALRGIIPVDMPLDKKNNTLLHIAVDQWCLDFIPFLIHWGADVTVVNKDGRTPLSGAPELTVHLIHFNLLLKQLCDNKPLAKMDLAVFRTLSDEVIAQSLTYFHNEAVTCAIEMVILNGRGGEEKTINFPHFFGEQKAEDDSVTEQWAKQLQLSPEMIKASGTHVEEMDKFAHKLNLTYQLLEHDTEEDRYERLGTLRDPINLSLHNYAALLSRNQKIILFSWAKQQPIFKNHRYDGANFFKRLRAPTHLRAIESALEEALKSVPEGRL